MGEKQALPASGFYSAGKAARRQVRETSEVVAGLAGSAIQVHAVNGDLFPAGQGAKGGAALQVIQKG